MERLASVIPPAAEARADEMIARLAAISRLDAPSGDARALALVADLLESWLGELAIRLTRHEGPAGPHLEAVIGPAGGGEALVLCHYDTVWPLGTARERPFRIDGGIAYGPGVLDMRGGIVAALSALSILRSLDGLRRRVRVLLTADEETGSRTSAELIARCARGAAIVLVPEPALPGGGLKTQRKGWISSRLEVTGRAAHAGLEPEAGVSAIHELLARLAEVRALADDSVGTTINIGRIDGGTAVNVVAERAVAEVDVRFSSAAEEERIRSALAALQAGADGARVDFVEVHSRPPLERTPAVAAAAARARTLGRLLGLELGEGAAGGVSDGNLAAAEGVPVLDGLGPEGGGAHATDERVDLRSMVERAALMALLLADI